VHKPLFVDVVVVGLFEEEEEGISIASDVVKVPSEDPDTPDYLRGDRLSVSAISDRGHGRGCVPLGSLVMNSRDRNDSPMSV